MKEFRSFLSPQIHSFIRYRQASQRWNDSSYEENLMLFDHYCHANDPCATALTQEMVDGWCRQRRTETNNSCRSRIYVVDSFIRFLNMRGLSNVQPPQIPRKERRRYLPQKHLLLQKMRTISITRKNKIPETLVNKGLLGFCSLFKLVSQEIDFCNFNSVFATFHCCIRHISRHNFDWHKNCTQNVLIYQSNYLFRNTEIISHYCIRP